mmetsp:Transcript_25540/g.41537  ORF Transcript_25540/g.41537 Transcript_25540/m.41537 type:complete len:288 (-) Transcript_25540:331-1194(-)
MTTPQRCIPPSPNHSFCCQWERNRLPGVQKKERKALAFSRPFFTTAGSDGSFPSCATAATAGGGGGARTPRSAPVEGGQPRCLPGGGRRLSHLHHLRGRCQGLVEDRVQVLLRVGCPLGLLGRGKERQLLGGGLRGRAAPPGPRQARCPPAGCRRRRRRGLLRLLGLQHPAAVHHVDGEESGHVGVLVEVRVLREDVLEVVVQLPAAFLDEFPLLVVAVGLDVHALHDFLVTERDDSVDQTPLYQLIMKIIEFTKSILCLHIFTICTPCCPDNVSYFLGPGQNPLES